MKPSHIASSLSSLITLDQPVFLWGPPGVGKSQVVAEVAHSAGRRLIDLRAVLLDPVDLRGLPRIDESGLAHWAPPAFLPRKGPQEEAGILFLDELNAAPPLVQAACYQLVLDRKLGEYELPSGWAILAAGNRETDRAVTHRMPSALANRFVHLDFDVDVDDWLAWAARANILPEVAAFIRFRPSLLLHFDPKDGEKSFASPRTWEFASRMLAAGTNPATRYDLVRGAVGEAAASEFMGFLEVWKELPDPAAVLKAPATAPVPDEPAALYAISQSVARLATLETADALVAYANRLPPEYSVLLMRDAVAALPALAKTTAFDQWAQDHAEVLV